MKYKSNIQSVVLNIEKKLKKASDVSALQRTIGTYLLASNLRRIHNNGLDVMEKRIGAYSIMPFYLNPKYSPKGFVPQGKHGQLKFKNGKPHQTKYFKLGYYGFRATIGRDVSKVNLQLSGKLKLDWTMSQEGKKFVLGFRSRYGTMVSSGNEERFASIIWGVTKKDQDEIKKIENEFIKKALA